MFSSQSAEVILDAPCRAIAAVWADKSEARFVAGSNTVQDNNNHLYVIRFHSEVNELGIDATISHPTGPVKRICCSPSDPSIVVTAAEHSSQATMWKIPSSVMTQDEGLQYNDPDNIEEDIDGIGGGGGGGGYVGGGGPAAVQMEELCSLGSNDDPTNSTGSSCRGHGTDVVDIVWRDSSDDYTVSSAPGGDCLTLDRNGKITQWDMSVGTAESVRETEVGTNNTKQQSTSYSCEGRVAWDPHGNGNAVAVTCGSSIQVLDWRADTSVPTGTVEHFPAHRSPVSDLDYNPNKPYVLATSGQDGLIKFWDLRAARHPLLVARGGHSHWASNVKYNPFHDQLVLSSGTDAAVNLWRVSTISSAPLLTFDDGDNMINIGEDGGAAGGGGGHSETSAPNVRVGRYEHGDSVYGITWASSDAWIYMALGYDGKAVLSHVPSKEKYRILL